MAHQNTYSSDYNYNNAGYSDPYYGQGGGHAAYPSYDNNAGAYSVPLQTRPTYDQRNSSYSVDKRKSEAVFGEPPKNTGDLRIFRHEAHGNLWTKGGRTAAFGRCCCCSIMTTIFVILSIAFSIAMWLRPPDISFGSIGPPTSGSAIEATNEELKINLSFPISVKNPNFFTVGFEQIAAKAYYPIGNVEIGGGSRDDISFASNSDTTFNFPFSIIYTSDKDRDGKVLMDIASRCGVGGSPKRRLDADPTAGGFEFSKKTKSNAGLRLKSTLGLSKKPNNHPKVSTHSSQGSNETTNSSKERLTPKDKERERSSEQESPFTEYSRSTSQLRSLEPSPVATVGDQPDQPVQALLPPEGPPPNNGGHALDESVQKDISHSYVQPEDTANPPVSSPPSFSVDETDTQDVSIFAEAPNILADSREGPSYSEISDPMAFTIDEAPRVGTEMELNDVPSIVPFPVQSHRSSTLQPKSKPQGDISPEPVQDVETVYPYETAMGPSIIDSSSHLTPCSDTKDESAIGQEIARDEYPPYTTQDTAERAAVVQRIPHSSASFEPTSPLSGFSQVQQMSSKSNGLNRAIREFDDKGAPLLVAGITVEGIMGTDIQNSCCLSKYLPEKISESLHVRHDSDNITSDFRLSELGTSIFVRARTVFTREKLTEECRFDLNGAVGAVEQVEIAEDKLKAIVEEGIAIYECLQDSSRTLFIPAGCWYQAIAVNGTMDLSITPVYSLAAVLNAFQQDVYARHRSCKSNTAPYRRLLYGYLHSLDQHIEVTPNSDPSSDDWLHSNFIYSQPSRILDTVQLFDRILVEEYTQGDREHEARLDDPGFCDFCGTDIFHAAFICSTQWALSTKAVIPSAGCEVKLCPSCCAEGRSCLCGNTRLCTTFDFDNLLSMRNRIVDWCRKAVDPFPPSVKVSLTDEDIYEATEHLHLALGAITIQSMRWPLPALDKNLPKEPMIVLCSGGSLAHDQHEMSRIHGITCDTCARETPQLEDCNESICFPHILTSGIHAAEAAYRWAQDRNWHHVHKTWAPRWVEWHRNSEDASRHPADIITNLARTLSLCRPVKPQAIRLGFYDQPADLVECARYEDYVDTNDLLAHDTDAIYHASLELGNGDTKVPKRKTDASVADYLNAHAPKRRRKVKDPAFSLKKGTKSKKPKRSLKNRSYDAGIDSPLVDDQNDATRRAISESSSIIADAEIGSEPAYDTHQLPTSSIAQSEIESDYETDMGLQSVEPLDAVISQDPRMRLNAAGGMALDLEIAEGNRYRVQLEELNSITAQLREENQHLIVKLSSTVQIEQRSKQLQEELDALRPNTELLNEAVSQAQALGVHKEKLEEDNENLRSRLKSSLEFQDGLQSQLNTMKEFANGLQRDINEVLPRRDQEVEDLKAQIRSLEANLRLTNAQLEELRARLKDTERQLKYQRSVSEKAEHDSRELRSTLNEMLLLERRVAEQEQTIADAEKEKQVMQTNLARYHEVLEQKNLELLRSKEPAARQGGDTKKRSASTSTQASQERSRSYSKTPSRQASKREDSPSEDTDGDGEPDPIDLLGGRYGK
ncbi:hypothetical protein FRC17_004342 [Serendipita sp. 399]|nr:hypothetical protein FRC17_004342 [Serendipita sp. 399]